MESLRINVFMGTGQRRRTPHGKKVLLNYSIAPIQQYSYTMEKRDRFGAHYRRDGYSLFGQCGRLLYRLVGQRFHPAGGALAGSRYVRSRYGGTEDSSPFIAACEKFKYLEVLASSTEDAQKAPAERPAAEKQGRKSSMASLFTGHAGNGSHRQRHFRR